MTTQDQLLEVFNRIPKDAHCESQAQVQKDIMMACWLYNQCISDKVQCKVCAWRNSISPSITKYLKGIGKL